MTDPDEPPTAVAIALGANLGDPASQIAVAIAALGALLTDLRTSSVRQTTPVGVAFPHPDYLNAAVTGLTRLTPRELLSALLDLERAMGRVRPHAGAPRTIDLDLILYGDVIVDEPGLRVPHPRFREREFVLEPLVEIAPGLRDPETGLTMVELLGRLGGRRADAG